jgi:serine/threonine protein kinase
MLQLCKGLSFLHTSARTIHSNINPESILINTAVRKVSGAFDGPRLKLPIGRLETGRSGPHHSP